MPNPSTLAMEDEQRTPIDPLTPRGKIVHRLIDSGLSPADAEAMLNEVLSAERRIIEREAHACNLHRTLRGQEFLERLSGRGK